jgi:hypothetical protein
MGEIAEPEIAEDRRRLNEFNRTRQAVPLGDVKAWVTSWRTENELPAPLPDFMTTSRSGCADRKSNAPTRYNFYEI